MKLLALIKLVVEMRRQLGVSMANDSKSTSEGVWLVQSKTQGHSQGLQPVRTKGQSTLTKEWPGERVTAHNVVKPCVLICGESMLDTLSGFRNRA